MTALEIKRNLCLFLIRNAFHWGAFTEFFGCDVVSLKRSLYTCEFEIKVDKRDLVKELNAIAFITRKEGLRKGCSKLPKHYKYLSNARFSPSRVFVPNEYYFVVPKSLVAIALKGVENTRYGVLLADERGFEYYTVIKRAKHLHDRKADTVVLYNLVRKASNELTKYR